MERSQVHRPHEWRTSSISSCRSAGSAMHGAALLALLCSNMQRRRWTLCMIAYVHTSSVRERRPPGTSVAWLVATCPQSFAICQRELGGVASGACSASSKRGIGARTARSSDTSLWYCCYADPPCWTLAMQRQPGTSGFACHNASELRRAVISTQC